MYIYNYANLSSYNTRDTFLVKFISCYFNKVHAHHANLPSSVVNMDGTVSSANFSGPEDYITWPPYNKTITNYHAPAQFGD